MNFPDDLLSLITDLLTLSPKAMLFYVTGLLIVFVIIVLCI